MKQKQPLIIAAVLLLAAIFLFLATREGGENTVTEGMLFRKVLSRQVIYSDVKSVEVYKGKDLPEKLTFEKTGEVWIQPAHYSARVLQKKIEELVENVNKMEGEVRSSDPALLGQYQLGERESIHIVFLDQAGKAINHVLLGMKGGNWNSCFVRENGSNDAFYVESNNPLYVLGIYTDAVDGALDGKRFHDKAVLAVSQDLKKVVVNREVDPFTVELIEESLPQEGTKPVEVKKTWKITSPAETEGDSTKISTWVNQLKSLYANDYVDPVLRASYELGTLSVSLEIANGETETVRFGPVKGGAYPLEKVGRNDLFTASEYSWNIFNKKLAELTAPPKPAEAPKPVEPPKSVETQEPVTTPENADAPKPVVEEKKVEPAPAPPVVEEKTPDAKPAEAPKTE